MEYGRDDDRGWTVERKKDEIDGPLAWVFAHGVLLAGGVILGAVAGVLLPLIMMAAPRRQRDTLMRTPSERRQDRLNDAVREKGTDMAIHGTEDDAKGRALIGAVLGGLAAIGVAVASRKKS